MPLIIHNPTVPVEPRFPFPRAWHHDDEVMRVYDGAIRGAQLCTKFHPPGSRGGRLPRLQQHLHDTSFFANVGSHPSLPSSILEPRAPKAEIRSCIGAGGFGAAFRVARLEQQPDGAKTMTSVMKVCPNAAKTRESWAGEVYALRQLSGLRQVANMIECQAHRSFLYIFMEEAEFGTLRDRLMMRISDEHLLAYLSSLAQAIKAVHERNIVHLDIKPHNIGIARSPLDTPESSLLGGREVRLIDWGVAELCVDSIPNRLCGTPYRIPPEMLAGQDLTKSADIWALGIVILEAVEGKKMENIVLDPAMGLDTRMRLLNIDYGNNYMAGGLRERWMASRRWDTQVGQILAPIVTACFNVDPSRRPTAAKIARILRAACERRVVKSNFGKWQAQQTWTNGPLPSLSTSPSSAPSFEEAHSPRDEYTSHLPLPVAPASFEVEHVEHKPAPEQISLKPTACNLFRRQAPVHNAPVHNPNPLAPDLKNRVAGEAVVHADGRSRKSGPILGAWRKVMKAAGGLGKAWVA